ncbi:Hypothetical protein FKW44_002657 [Caligus rogercresseyi]|uniref:Uncharacterized protein n=1 Tax=Caligus rogercresseyi TaxID=217165 RepID=A0A7T8KKI1_CALRO|nr:Hypothetical protein FKW44_002657 [Caligus rogercresseyi]
MRRLMSTDLGLKSLAKVQLTPLQRDKRVNMCQIKLKEEAVWKVLVFSGEKDFQLNKYFNRKPGRTIASFAKAMDLANRS